MILDERLEFCDATSVAAAAGTALVGDVINVQEIGKDLGQTGMPLYLVIQCTTNIITAGNAGTILFKLASDDSATIHTSTSTVHWTSKSFVTDDNALNELDAGAVIARVPLPMNSIMEYEQYLGILVTVVTTEVTAGAINAFLTFAPANWKAHADAVN